MGGGDSLRAGCGLGASRRVRAGVRGRSPWRGARGAEPPGKFLQKYRLKDHFLPIRKQEIEAS